MEATIWGLGLYPKILPLIEVSRLYVCFQDKKRKPRTPEEIAERKAFSVHILAADRSHPAHFLRT